MKGLGLVDFEFMPHWDRGIYKIEEFLAYSIESRRSLYLCNDGDGIIVNDNDIDLVGDIIKIENGMTYRIKGQ
ncbi:hypothetical protein [Brassicibacter mesophilus]|uniref:hypothetical protein n=1 Tax=Brassicibacter mesophilus TaxID=745119 RepID=UPI003D19A588